MSDTWEGLETFFRPTEEMVIVRSAADVIAALELSDEELGRMAHYARERTLSEHTSDRRVRELEAICEQASAQILPQFAV